MKSAVGRRKGRAATSLKSIEHAAVYAAVVASALDAVIVVDEEGCVVAINPAAEATFGYSRKEAMGKPIGALIVPDHLKQAHEQGFARYRATRKPHVLGRRVEMEARCKDGRLIPVELAITEVSLPDRRLFTASLRDLSAAREAMAEIERQRDALHQSEKLAALGSMLAGVAHELNNPLTIVLGQATMLREEAAGAGSDPAIRARAEKIEAAAERCARVVRSFLTIARQRKAETRAVALSPLLDSSIDLMLYGLRSSGVTVIRDYDESLPEILADPDQVQQVVFNLLVNAAQALEETEARREIRVSVRVARDGKLGVVVADSGPGVPRDIAQRIFEPFFTTKPLGSGTGIGLSVSRGLAEAQGGTLALLASQKGGAAFELSLPLAAGETGAKAGKGVDGASDPRTGRVAKGNDREPRAIVIDDEPEITVLLAEALRKAGYACDVATGGREGQAMIAANPGSYDALICDLRMPDIDGPKLFRWISAHHPALAKRTVFVTGDALGPAAGLFLARSRRPVLEKPFTPADVARLISGFPPRTSARLRRS
jgi:two-component system NtrC family sensor kinase